MKRFIILFGFLLISLSYNSQTLFNYGGKQYTFIYKKEGNSNYRFIIIGRGADNKIDTTKSANLLPEDFDLSNFRMEFIDMLQIHTGSNSITPDATLSKEIERLYSKTKDGIENDKIEVQKKTFRDELKTAMDSISKSSDSAYVASTIYLKGPFVPLYESDRISPIRNTYFKITKAEIRIRDNEISDVQIEGTIVKFTKKDTTVIYPNAIIDNGSYCVSIYRLNEYNQYILFEADEQYKVYYCDVFGLKTAHGKTFDYNFTDGNYTLVPGGKNNEQHLLGKSLNDYFSFMILGDVIAIDQSKPNSLLQTEGLLKLSTNATNDGYFRFSPYIEFSGNLSKLDAKRKFIQADSARLIPKAIHYVNNYTALDNSRFNVGCDWTILSLNSKPAGIHFNLKPGYRIFIANAGFRQNDSTITSSIYLHYYHSTLQFHIAGEVAAGGITATIGGLFQSNNGYIRQSFGRQFIDGVPHYYPYARDHRRLMFVFEGYFMHKDGRNGGFFGRVRLYCSPANRYFQPEFAFGYLTAISKFFK